ncbi:MAG: family 1 glycosylhydrolase, partial [Nocardioides sp.]
LHNRVFLDPILTGSYPADLVADTADLTWQGEAWPTVVRDGDLALISTPIDVLGVNYYKGDAVSGHPQPVTTGMTRSHAERATSTPFVGCEDVTFPSRGLPVTAMGWEVQPEGLTRLLQRLDADYDVPPMYVTENGAAYDDEIDADGRVHDPERRAYIADHLAAVHAAIAGGVDVRGFFQWSLLDNYEWAYGFDKRFGIVHVDYDTQVRTPKSSALYYADVAATGRLRAPGS